MKEFYIENRRKFGEIMVNGSILVIYAGAAPVKRGDEFYEYAPQRNFLYMTGIERPSLVFTMKKNFKGEVSSRLYIERFDETYAKWEGAPINKEAATEISGIDTFSYLDELDGHLAKTLVRERFTMVYLDLENRSFHAPNTPELDLAARLREKFPAVGLTNAHPLFGGLRLIKAANEIMQIQKAADITGQGFYAFLDNVRPGMMEYELEAFWEYICKKNGAKKAFSTIMASGKNATVLHYRDNASEIKDGDLVLVDFGGQINWYCADLSRTFPANGKFTPRQRQIYDIVLEAGKRVIAMVKPGVKFSDLNEAVKKFYAEELTKIGLISEEKDVAKYYYHGVSHMLGLETHDVGAGSTSTDGELLLAPGMVITVEPGLYIEEEAIGIRIEDNVLVTATGSEVLTKDIIKEATDIEEYMLRRGGALGRPS
ncbi:MAG: aminopeptidase P family protein [Clostridiales bacterium]|nr:aminopeptidase P family protein [Clostridiales bacterium]